MTPATPQSTAEELSLARVTILPPYPKNAPDATLGEKFQTFVTWVQATRPMRVVQHWSERRGGTLASGMAYSALFSVLAALLVFFSVIGLVLGSDKALLEELVGTLSSMVPGLIGTGEGDGVVSAADLMRLDAGSSFTVAGVIALLSTLWTAMNFLNGSRLAIRAMFDLPAAPERNVLLTRLTDLGLMIAGGIVLVLAVAVVAAGSGLATWLLNDVLRLEVGALTTVLIRLASVVVALGANLVIVASMLRILSQIRIPPNTLWSGSLIGAVAISLLTFLGSALLGGATSNPLVATFATVLGVLIFFNFLCMVLLITASWVKVTMDDLGQAARILSLEAAEQVAHRSELAAKRDRLAAERLRLEAAMAALPRWKRRRVRRDYERLIAAQAELEHELRNERMGYDPVAAEADRHGLNKNDIRLRR